MGFTQTRKKIGVLISRDDMNALRFILKNRRGSGAAIDSHVSCHSISVRICPRRLTSDVTSEQGGPDSSGGPREAARYPVIQFPSHSLMTRQPRIDPSDIVSESTQSMLIKLRRTRDFYAFPSLSAPQVGWNCNCFVLFDGTVYFNATVTIATPALPTAWTWEANASFCHALHYIERPLLCRMDAYDDCANKVALDLTGMTSRLVQHEVEALSGVLFARRVPDMRHIVPVEGFHTMSDWEDDFPSIEARSTSLYTLLVPAHLRAADECGSSGRRRPLQLLSEYLPNSDFLRRRFEDGIYPGCHVDQRLLEEDKALESQMQDMAGMLRKQSAAAK